MDAQAAGSPAAGLHPPPLGGWIALLVVAVAVAAVIAVTVRLGWARLAHGPRRPRTGLLVRLRLRLWPGPGWARRWAVWRRHGKPAARKTARTARPSLTWAARHFGPWQAYATFLGWSSAGWLLRLRVYANLESLTLMIAPPQEGKSQAAAGMVIDAPGAVLVTSIRGDLIASTAGLRARAGRLHVWAPEGEGGYASTLRWNPVHGCADVVTAVRRGGYMTEAVAATGRGDDAFWDDHASMVLAALLHAAALAGAGMAEVARWASSEDPAPGRILAAHPGASRQARDYMAWYLALAPRTRSGISSTLARVLRFMQHPGCAEAVLVPGGGPGFDPARFVRSRDTLYLVAADGATSPVRPLFTALAGEVAFAVRAAGGVPPAGQRPGTVVRLDPPLRMVLDELTNVAPVPVAAWSSWAAGSGLQLALIVQAYAQLEQRWGERGAETIWQCCKTKMIYGATTETRLSQMTEQLCGRVRVRTTERTGDGRRHRHEDMARLPAAALRELPPGLAVLVQGHAPPVIVRTERVRDRADYRRQARDGAPVNLPAPRPRTAPQPAPGLLHGRPDRKSVV